MSGLADGIEMRKVISGVSMQDSLPAIMQTLQIPLIERNMREVMMYTHLLLVGRATVVLVAKDRRWGR